MQSHRGTIRLTFEFLIENFYSVNCQNLQKKPPEIAIFKISKNIFKITLLEFETDNVSTRKKQWILSIFCQNSHFRLSEHCKPRMSTTKFLTFSDLLKLFSTIRKTLFGYFWELQIKSG